MHKIVSYFRGAGYRQKGVKYDDLRYVVRESHGLCGAKRTKIVEAPFGLAIADLMKIIKKEFPKLSFNKVSINSGYNSWIGECLIIKEKE